jgi:hypothetical protein
MVKVKFVNKSGERVTLYQGGGILRILEPGNRWNRDPSEGTLRTTVVMDENMKFPPPRPGPRWIKETEWVWEECPEGSMYAPFRTITFLDGNEVKLKRRPRWKAPEMKWPCVLFLFKSRKLKIHKLHLDRDVSSFPATFYNGIPVRISVHPLSKYAPFKKWIFDEAPAQKDGNPPFKNMKEVYEMTERGEQKRTPAELEKIAELKAKDEERRKLGLF